MNTILKVKGSIWERKKKGLIITILNFNVSIKTFETMRHS